MLDGVKRLILCGVLSVGAACLIGCEPEKDELSQAMDKARAELGAIHTSGGRAAPDELREEVYGRVISSLKSKQNAGSEGSKGAAGLMMSEAQRGLAEIASGRARAADSKVTYLMSGVLSQLSVYRKQTTLSESLSAYDPAGDIEGYQAQIDLNTGQVETLSGEIASLEKDMELKRAFVATKLDAAKASRAQSSEVRGRLMDAVASGRVALAEEAVSFQRTADSFEREGALAEIEASEYEPKIESVRREILLLRGRRKALEEGIERARGAASRWGEQAKSAKRDADRAGREVSEALNEIASLYEKEVSVQYTAALEKLEEASSSARKARGDREAKQAAEAAIGHAQASIQIEHAQAAARLAGFIDEAVRSPSPSGVRSMRSMAGKLRGTSGEMLEGAGQAYEQAEQAYSGLRIKDAYTQGQLDSLGQKLSEIGAALRGDELDVEESTGTEEALDEGAPVEDEVPAGRGRERK